MESSQNPEHSTMRILLLIIMVVAMLVATGMGFMFGEKNILSGEAVETTKLIEHLGDSEQARKLGGYRISGFGGVFVGIMALIMVVVTFMKKTKSIQVVAGTTALSAIAFIAISPGFETARHGAESLQEQAMIYGIFAILVALCGFGAEQMRFNKGG